MGTTHLAQFQDVILGPPFPCEEKSVCGGVVRDTVETIRSKEMSFVHDVMGSLMSGEQTGHVIDLHHMS